MKTHFLREGRKGILVLRLDSWSPLLNSKVLFLVPNVCHTNLGVTCRSAVLCLQGRDPHRGKILTQHTQTQNKNIFVLSKDDVKASCTDTERAFVYAESMLRPVFLVTGHTGALTVSQHHYLTTVLLRLLGEPTAMVNATALTENKNSCQEAAVGTVFFPNRALISNMG